MTQSKKHSQSTFVASAVLAGALVVAEFCSVHASVQASAGRNDTRSAAVQHEQAPVNVAEKLVTGPKSSSSKKSAAAEARAAKAEKKKADRAAKREELAAKRAAAKKGPSNEKAGPKPEDDSMSDDPLEGL